MNTARKTILLGSLLLATATANADWSLPMWAMPASITTAAFSKRIRLPARASTTSPAASTSVPGQLMLATAWKLTFTAATAPTLATSDLSVGFTGYYYTGDFDDTYQESQPRCAGFGGFSLDVAIGEYDNFDGPTQDYTYASLTYQKTASTASTPIFPRTSTAATFEDGLRRHRRRNRSRHRVDFFRFRPGRRE